MINMVRVKSVGLPFAFVVSILALGSEVARAQHLYPTQWMEAVAFCGDDACEDLVGADNLTPERVSGDLSGQDWSLTGGVSYEARGAPSFAVSLDVQHASGLSRYLIGRVSNNVTFQFRVRQYGGPPQAVDYVPLTIRMQGAAAVSGDPLPAHAESGIHFETADGAVWGFAGRARGSNDPYNPPASASLDQTFSYGLRPGTVIYAGMGAGVRIAGAPESGSTHATASIGAAIEVADQLIPGTSTNYRDLYEIEFSPGFFALDPVAVRPSTWSAVKSLYRGVGR